MSAFRTCRSPFPFAWVLILVLPWAANAAADGDDKLTFVDQAQSIFQARCAACHNPDKKSGGLDLSTYLNLMEGGASGTSIEPGDPEGSYLFSLVTHEEEPHMPPGSARIPDAEIETLKRWIAGGALETKTSKARTKKKTIGAAAGSSMERPALVALPPRLPLEPALVTPKPGCVHSLATSPWAPIVALTAPRQILLYHTAHLQLVGVLAYPEGQPNVVRFSRNGQLLLAAGGRDGASGKVVIWDVASGERIAEVGNEADTVLAADISADHTLVALGGPQKVVRVYSTQDGSLRYEIRKHTEWITALAFSPDGVLLASGDRNGGTFVWEAPSGNPYLELKGHTERITDLSWRWDSNLLASASQDTTIRLWELENGGQVKSWGAHGGGVTAIQFNRAGNLASTGRDRVPKIWNQNGEALKQFTALSELGTAVAFCNETHRLVAGDWLGQVQVFNEADGAVLGGLNPNPPTLASRLQAAQTGLAQAAAAHEPVAAEVAALQKTFDELRTALAAQVTSRTALQESAAQLEKQMITTQEQLAAKLAEQAAWQAEHDEKAKLKPELQALAEKAAAVAALSPNDAELKASAEQLGNKFRQVDSRVGELTTALTQASEMRTLTEQQMKQLAEQLAGQKAKIDELNSQVAAMEKQQGSMDTVLKEKQVVLQAAAASLNEAQTQVGRWQAEIQFLADLKKLFDERLASQSLIEQRISEQESIQRELDAVQQRLNAATAAVQEATAAEDTVEIRIRELQGIK